MKYQKILEDDEYKQYLKQLQNLEQNRIYCKHDLNHFLDVARICTITAYDHGISVDKDIVYAAGLLHDIGRCDPKVSSHEEHSAKIANEILPKCGYTKDEVSQIIEIILSHRGRDVLNNIKKLDKSDYLDIVDCFKIADQLSRNCFCCDATITCKWKDEEKLESIIL